MIKLKSNSLTFFLPLLHFVKSGFDKTLETIPICQKQPKKIRYTELLALFYDEC